MSISEFSCKVTLKTEPREQELPLESINAVKPGSILHLNTFSSFLVKNSWGPPVTCWGYASRKTLPYKEEDQLGVIVISVVLFDTGGYSVFNRAN